MKTLKNITIWRWTGILTWHGGGAKSRGAERERSEKKWVQQPCDGQNWGPNTKKVNHITCFSAMCYDGAKIGSQKTSEKPLANRADGFTTFSSLALTAAGREAQLRNKTRVVLDES